MIRAALVSEVMAALIADNIAITELNVAKPSLDEVFMTITGKPATTDAHPDPENSENSENSDKEEAA